MTVKMTGLEVKLYWDDASVWPDDAYIDEDIIAVNGVDQVDFCVDDLKNTDSVVFKSGVVIIGNKSTALTSHCRNWLKSQREKVIVVSIPNEKHDALVAMITANGGKVHK